MPFAKATFLAWSRVGSISNRVVASLRAHGMLAAARRARRRVCERVREWKLGIRTVGSIDAASLNSGADSFGYQPIPYAAVEAALESVDCRPHDVFVDLGCGLGRAVIVAATRSMRRAIGVEISPDLCVQARHNVARAQRHFRTQNVEIVEADARDYVLPDDATVLLLFNPFDEPILRRVLENSRQSLIGTPRTLTIIYAIPKSRRDLLADVPWLRLQRTLSITDEDWLRLGIYRCEQEVS